LPSARYPDAAAHRAFFDHLTTRLAAIPGVRAVALADNLPALYATRHPYESADDAPVDAQKRPTVTTVVIGPEYFATLGGRVLKGRLFEPSDDLSAPHVTLVNERFANLIWPGEEPIGKRIRLFDGNKADAWRTVVGIVSDIVQNDPTGQTFEPVVYLPFHQSPRSAMAVVVRTAVPPATLATAVRREIERMDSDLSVFSGLGSIEGPKTLAEGLAFNYWSNGVNGALFLIFAAAALLLASVGLYAVVAHAVSERTQEIGVRMAFGATTRDVLSLVVTQSMRPVGIGVVLGLLASLGVTPLLRSQLVGVSAVDPLTLTASTAVLACAALIGCLIPALRATRVDPSAALRHE
jgi:putative ABC transport system permease protein